ncbi:MAG: hypothetical protein IPK71_32875 [Myxococcales bacterium]|nr:hypothetical protein [Myxococcales bacterium]
MNPRAYGIFLLVALLVFVVAHAVVVVRCAVVARARTNVPDADPYGVAKKLRGPWLALLVVFPPLAPYYAWSLGEGYFAVAWLVTLAVYAVGVGVA